MDEEAIERGIYNRLTLFVALLAFTAVTTGIAYAYAPAGVELWRVVIFGVAAGPLCFLMVFVNHLIAPTADGF